MATRRPTRAAAKTTTTVTTTEPVETEGAAPAPASVEEVMQQQANDSLVALMAELGSIDGSRCTVHRAEKNQPLEYVFACSPSEFSLDDLRDKYGGGTFRLFVTKPGHTGVWRNMLVHVARTAGTPMAADPNAAMLSVMREGFARQAEVLKAALAPQVPAGEPVTMATILPQLPAIITAAAAAITALRPPTPAPAPVAQSKDSGIELFIKGVELAQDLRGGGDGDGGGLMGILREFVKSPMMGAAVQAMAAQPQATHQPTRPALAAPQPQAAPVPAPAPTPTDQPMNAPNAALAHYLGMLCAMSQNGKDPALYADLVLDNAPDQLLDELLAADDGVAYLAQYQPQVANHRQWFTQLINIVRDAMTGPDDTAHNNVGHVDGSGARVVQGADATVNPSAERTG